LASRGDCSRQTHDREGCHALFAALASLEKRWLSYPGAHGGRSEQELQDSIRQLALA